MVYPANQSRSQNVYHGNGLLGVGPQPEAEVAARTSRSHQGSGWTSTRKRTHSSLKKPSSSSSRNVMEPAGLKPSILVNSGTGCHAYWITDEPCGPRGDARAGHPDLAVDPERSRGHVGQPFGPAARLPAAGDRVVGQGRRWPAERGGNKSVTTPWCQCLAGVMPKERLRELTQRVMGHVGEKADQERIRAERRAANKDAYKQWTPAALGLPGGPGGSVPRGHGDGAAGVPADDDLGPTSSNLPAGRSTEKPTTRVIRCGPARMTPARS